MKHLAILPFGRRIDRIAVPDDQCDQILRTGERFEVLLGQDWFLQRPVERIGSVGMAVKSSYETRSPFAITRNCELQLFHVSRGRPPLHPQRIPRATPGETAEVLALSRTHSAQHLLELGQILKLVPVFVGTIEDRVHGVHDRPRQQDDRLAPGTTEDAQQSPRRECAHLTEPLERTHFEE